MPPSARAQPDGVADHRLEDRLELGRRAHRSPQDLARRRLLLDRVGEISREPVHPFVGRHCIRLGGHRGVQYLHLGRGDWSAPGRRLREHTPVRQARRTSSPQTWQRAGSRTVADLDTVGEPSVGYVASAMHRRGPTHARRRTRRSVRQRDVVAGAVHRPRRCVVGRGHAAGNSSVSVSSRTAAL